MEASAGLDLPGKTTGRAVQSPHAISAITKREGSQVPTEERGQKLFQRMVVAKQ
jgi:hypothetical protein